MDIVQSFTSSFVSRSRAILQDRLVGIYLHGSAAMGCFNEKKSDIDLLIVVNGSLTDDVKRSYMDMTMELLPCAPAKGMEWSIVRSDVCMPFAYPTPYELHYSNAHLAWYQSDPDGYIQKMNGVDKDLAAHFTITLHRGKCLWGKPIRDVFADVSPDFYFDSIWFDVANAAEEVTQNPMYMVLNLCRVWAYQRDKLITSKLEGGLWGLSHVPAPYHAPVASALDAYRSDRPMQCDDQEAQAFARWMIEQLRHGMDCSPGATACLSKSEELSNESGGNTPS